MCKSDPSRERRCCCGLKGMLAPRILLHIAKRPMHGYELLEKFSGTNHPEPPDAGGLYRLLRTMEKDALLTSQWETNDSGPAKRVYHMTDAGFLHLKDWSVTLSQTNGWIEHFLDEFKEIASVQQKKEKD